MSATKHLEPVGRGEGAPLPPSCPEVCPATVLSAGEINPLYERSDRLDTVESAPCGDGISPQTMVE